MSLKAKGRDGVSRGGDHGARSTKLREVGLISELPVLHIGNPAEVVEFKEELTTYIRRLYPDLGIFMVSMEYPKRTIPKRPKGYDPADEDHVSSHRQRVAATTAAMERDPLDKVSIHCVIWGQLSRDSKDRVRRHRDWKAIRLGGDPLLLWRAIEDTHLSCDNGNPRHDRLAVEDYFNRLVQLPNESIVRFKERFDAALLALGSIGLEIEDGEALADKFIYKLDESTYGAFKKQLVDTANMLGANTVYPKTLVDAYELALKRQESRTTTRELPSGPQVVFHTPAEPVRVKVETKKRGKRRQPKGGNDKTVANKSVPDKSVRRRACYLCGEAHFISECPSRDLVKKLLAKHKAGDRHTVAAAIGQHQDYIEVGSEECAESGHYAFPALQDVCGPCPGASTQLVATSARGSTPLGKFEVLLDNGATRSIFRERSLLTNLRKISPPMSFSGIGGTVSSDTVGDVPFIGTVNYAPEGAVNILSLREMEDRFRVTYVQSRYFHLPQREDIHRSVWGVVDRANEWHIPHCVGGHSASNARKGHRWANLPEISEEAPLPKDGSCYSIIEEHFELAQGVLPRALVATNAFRSSCLSIRDSRPDPQNELLLSFRNASKFFFLIDASFKKPPGSEEHEWRDEELFSWTKLGVDGC